MVYFINNSFIKFLQFFGSLFCLFLCRLIVCPDSLILSGLFSGNAGPGNYFRPYFFRGNCGVLIHRKNKCFLLICIDSVLYCCIHFFNILYQNKSNHIHGSKRMSYVIIQCDFCQLFFVNILFALQFAHKYAKIECPAWNN